ncbi:D-alanyl-D-alanine carboxypeptidase/D-alanyl-D-alanine-endopeptidase [Anaeromyxobacter sp. SG64]|uniref:D-alanyl-D-alanine carboxypeptidase/D-alanyl-D-alanine endopeptidase n=1 Tax=Anaeromyxobacter sp. SG64 TaxID=2925409 RepID=UPI001F56C5F9|nr:D-alanyl-D-alanine carboxypeptidase/D-alanyl-D-alanine-endopeptidase [Anaeromyxobacter sp. SG64]
MTAIVRAAAATLAVLLSAPSAAEPPSQRDLQAALDSIVQGSALAGARAGVLVADVTSGDVLYAREADVLLNPASNVKLVTSAAALARLGPGYRFATEFLVDAPSARSPQVRTLYVRGRGDPTLVTERLWAIAGELAHLGIRRVGDVVLDDGWFDAERYGPGYDQEEGDRSYLAPTGALSLNWNAVAVYVGPGAGRGQKGRVELEPQSPFFEVVNRTRTVGPRGRRHVTVESSLAGGRQRIVISGPVPAGSRVQPVWRRVDDPPRYLGHTLARLLELRGVKVMGAIHTGAVPRGAKLVHVATSDTLAEIVRRLNKNSNNFVAEQLVKTLGAEAKGAPGSWPKGIEAVGEFLATLGVPRGAYVMKNGSGLNDTNRFSARQLVTLLRAMWARFPLQAEYVTSLPVAGRDGTIRWRMDGTAADGHLRAKTGTLENVTSLSGYVETAGRRTLAFAVIVNDYPGRHAGVVRAVDALGTAIAASGGTREGLEAAVALANAPEGTAVPVATPADLAVAVRTYYGLGRAADPRNVSFLRTALRTESDPALRLAVAESIYLSEPDGETARRAFLDAATSDPQALGRLLAALGPDEPVPVLPSLGDLAAEGEADALARLLELAPAAVSDARLGAALAEVMGAVASSAPEEILTALRAAPAPLQEATISVLARGLAAAEEGERPFREALRAAGEKPGDAGAFARALEPRLEAALQAGAAVRAAPALLPASTAPATPRR